MLLSEVEFRSFLAYSPHGSDDAARQSQRWVRNLKSERMLGAPPEATSALIARRVKARMSEAGLLDFLTPNTLLVPAPGSALVRPGGLWIPNLIARALVSQGLGGDSLACLQRISPVRKAATSAPDDRPSALEHFESMSVRRLSFPHDDVVVVDDVVTRGATLLAAISRLKETLPGARVRGFAIVRTLTDPAEFTQMFDPCAGRIALRNNGHTTRRP